MAARSAADKVDGVVFQVAVGGISIPAKAQRDQIQGSLWAQVFLVNDSGEELTHIWYSKTAPEEKERTVTKIIDPPIRGIEAANFSYQQASKSITPSLSSFAELLTATIHVVVYEGESREPPHSRRLGLVEVPLAKALVGDGIDDFLDFTSGLLVESAKDGVNRAETSSATLGKDVEDGVQEEQDGDSELPPAIELTVTVNDTLLEAIEGSTALTFDQLKLKSVPDSWTPPQEEDESQNRPLYSALVYFPLYEDQPKQLLNCRVTSETITPATPSPAEGETGGAVVDPPPAPSHLWSLRFDGACTMLYDKEKKEQLKALMAKSGSLKCVIERVAPPSSPPEKEKGPAKGVAPAKKGGSISAAEQKPPLDVWRLEVEFPLNDLAAPGERSVAPSTSSIALAPPLTLEDVKKREEAVESNDKESQLVQLLLQAAGQVQSTDSANPSPPSQATEQLAILKAKGTEAFCRIRTPLPLSLPPPPPPPPTHKVTDFLPSRPPLPPFPSRDACVEFRGEVCNIIKTIVAEYEVCAKETNGDVRPKFFYKLNSQRIYHAFKEKLKGYIVRIVKERYPERPAPEAEESFYSELYAYLMQEVNKALNETLHLSEPTIPQPALHAFTAEEESKSNPLSKTKALAEEAEANEDWEKAKKLYLDCIALAEEEAPKKGAWNPKVWFDYGLFSLRQADVTNAVKSLRECLTIDSEHLGALLTYGALLLEQRELAMAEVVIKSAVEVSEKSRLDEAPLSHSLLALYFRLSGTDPRGRLCQAEITSATNSWKSREQGEGDEKSGISKAAVCYDLAAFLCERKLHALAAAALDMADGVVTQEDKKTLRSRQRLLKAQVLALSKDFQGAKIMLQAAAEQDPSSPELWDELGHVQEALGDNNGARESYTRVLSLLESKEESKEGRAGGEGQSGPEKGIRIPLKLFLRLGHLYLQSSQPAVAREILLRGCSLFSPLSPSLWLLIGVSSIRLEHWQDAEDALSEANMLDNTNADVWGYLALLCLSVSPPRTVEANQALDQALRLGMMNATLLRELGTLYMSLDRLEVAEGLLRRSLGAHESSLTRKRLADVLQAQNCAESALAEYQALLNTCDNIQERCEALEQCAKLLTTLERKEEALSYRQMAQKQAELLQMGERSGEVEKREGEVVQTPPQMVA